jgi:hypothetical protein
MEWNAELVLEGGELTVLVGNVLAIENGTWPVLTEAAAEWVGDDVPDESVSVRTAARVSEAAESSWTDDLSLWSIPSRKEVGRAMGNAET